MLARIRKAQDNNEGGFTLIELLVVMIIIGILAAIAIPAFLSQKNKGYEASVKSDLRSIATEIETILVDEPASVTVGITGGNATVTPTFVPAVTGLTAPVINLTAGNQGAGTVGGSATAGYTYCVNLKSDKGGNAFKVSKAANQSQVITPGTCV